MSRVYNCIDADGHILEPLELWTQYMEPKYRDHAPRLVRDNHGNERLLIGQKTLGGERGMGALGAVGSRDGTVVDSARLSGYRAGWSWPEPFKQGRSPSCRAMACQAASAERGGPG